MAWWVKEITSHFSGWVASHTINLLYILSSVIENSNKNGVCVLFFDRGPSNKYPEATYKYPEAMHEYLECTHYLV